MTLSWNRATQSIDRGDASALPSYPIDIWEFDEFGFVGWAGRFDDLLKAVEFVSDYHGEYRWNTNETGPFLGTLDSGPNGVEITIDERGATQ